MTRVAIVKYGVGNIYSVRAGLERVGARVEVVESAWDALKNGADGVVLPGVGSYAAVAGRIAGEREAILELAGRGVPLLGVCLGMQLFFEESEEGGRGLGLLPGRVERLGAAKLPHMGWSRVKVRGESTLLEGVGDNAYMYFMHSYAYKDVARPWVKAVSHHGEVFAAVIEAPPLYGTQFHPERSGRNGAIVLSNFVRLLRT